MGAFITVLGLVTAAAWMGARQRESLRADPPFGELTLLAFAVVAGFDLFTWWFFSVACAMGENMSQPWLGFCRGSAVRAMPLIGAAIMASGLTFSRIAGRSWLAMAALVVGLGAGLGVWLIMGDPAGNFAGLATD